MIKYQNVNNLIIYSDGSKCEKTGNLGAGIFYTKNFSAENSGSLSWNLDSHMEVFDAELFAMEKAFKLAYNQLFLFVRDIWIFSDSQAVIQRVQKSSLKTGQSHVLAIENWVKKIQAKHQADIYLSWVPGQGGFSYVDIIDNDIAIDNVSTVDIDKLIDIYSNTGLRYWYRASLNKPAILVKSAI